MLLKGRICIFLNYAHLADSRIYLGIQVCAKTTRHVFTFLTSGAPNSNEGREKESDFSVRCAIWTFFLNKTFFNNSLFVFVVTLIGQILLTGIQLVVITYGSSLISYKSVPVLHIFTITFFSLSLKDQSLIPWNCPFNC